MDDMEEFRNIFFQECNELLTALEDSLSAIEAGTETEDTVNAAFRAIHSIKGGAGAFGFDGMVNFCHTFENVLDRLRNKQIEQTLLLIQLMLRSKDVVMDLVENAQQGSTNLENIGTDILKELEYVQQTGQAPDPATFNAGGGEASTASAKKVEKTKKTEEVVKKTEPQVEVKKETPEEPQEREVLISFKPDSDCLRAAIEPLQLFESLKALGALNVKVKENHIPDPEDLEVNKCYLIWELNLWTAAPKVDIEDVFIFAQEYADVQILDENDNKSEEEITVDAISADAGDTKEEAALETKQDTKQEIVEAVTTNNNDDAKIEIKKPVDDDSAKIDIEKQNGSSTQQAVQANKPAITLRVDLPRIDRLVNMVGETVITQSVLAQQASHLSPEQHSGLLHAIESLSRQTRELQESVMAIRAQPVKNVFQRMNRLVRELNLSLSKEAKLVLVGENTEVDTTVIEEIADPLTHMIRNSMDHGLETPEERVKNGKPREGTIRLSAEHRSSRIVITISDDGRGINRERVLDIAVKKGLVPADAKLSIEEIENLVFMPGFSTAEKISSVSGRGVGMDVVRRNIQALGGRVFINSTPGKGTIFTMTLPLTLAVLDGMVIRAGHESFVIPITSIVEACRLQGMKRDKLPNGTELLNMRGQYIKLINLGHILNEPLIGDDLQVVVVETEAQGQVGLVVDDLIGQQQIVIKSLETNYKRIDGISGATILGDGKVALILDVDTISVLEEPVKTGNLLLLNTLETEQ